jgi:NADPH-dependent 2,4-dienoyl-CoA reductase/sulfur reductase-like enzyme
MTERVVIVGASVAGIRVAQALRSEGFDGSVTLIDADANAPYNKPPLSKDVISHSSGLDSIVLMNSEELSALGLSLLKRCAAQSLDTRSKSVFLSNGQVVSYDTLVLATGARPRPSLWAIKTPQVHTLRSFDDALRLRARLKPGHRLAIIGAGLVGCELAASSNELGVNVTLVDFESTILRRVLPPELGYRLQVEHERRGVLFRLGDGVQEINNKGDAISISLTHSDQITVDDVVVCIGSLPNTDWLKSSSLDISDGVLCNEFGQAVGDASVYAIGDVSRWCKPTTDKAVREEHWTNAIQQANFVAKQIVGNADHGGFRPEHYVWSEQFGWKLQIVGVPEANRSVQVLENPQATESFCAVSADCNGIATYACCVNWPVAFVRCRRAIQEKMRPDQIF